LRNFPHLFPFSIFHVKICRILTIFSLFLIFSFQLFDDLISPWGDMIAAESSCRLDDRNFQRFDDWRWLVSFAQAADYLGKSEILADQLIDRIRHQIEKCDWIATIHAIVDINQVDFISFVCFFL